MDLYNCISDTEISLKETELDSLADGELEKLANNIHKMYYTGELQDDQITVDALLQIAQEQARRLRGHDKKN